MNPFHGLMQLNLKVQWSGSWPGHLTPETWRSNTGWTWPLPTLTVSAEFILAHLQLVDSQYRTIKLGAAKQDLYKPVSFIKQKWKTTSQTGLNFMFYFVEKEGASLHKTGSSLVQNLICFIALWCRAVLFCFVLGYRTDDETAWDILVNTDHSSSPFQLLVSGVQAAQLHPSVSGASVVLLMPLTHKWRSRVGGGLSGITLSACYYIRWSVLCSAITQTTVQKLPGNICI